MREAHIHSSRDGLRSKCTPLRVGPMLLSLRRQVSDLTTKLRFLLGATAEGVQNCWHSVLLSAQNAIWASTSWRDASTFVTISQAFAAVPVSIQ